VFNAADGYGEFAEMSTQAVMNLIKNVDVNDQEGLAHVEITASEVDSFYLPRPEVANCEVVPRVGKFKNL
jgi:hypothetical protein